MTSKFLLPNDSTSTHRFLKKDVINLFKPGHMVVHEGLRQPKRLYKAITKKYKRAVSEVVTISQASAMHEESRVPVVRWMQSYKHENLVPDIVAGVTLAIYNVPQKRRAKRKPPISSPSEEIGSDALIDAIALLNADAGRPAYLKTIVAHLLENAAESEELKRKNRLLEDKLEAEIAENDCLRKEKWYAIAEGLPNTNLVTLAISVSTITFLVLYKKIVEPILKKKNISLPAELLALVIITFISAVAHFHDRFGVIIVGDIPTGLPPPKVPLFEEVLIKRLIVPAASIAVVAYAVTVSMGKLFARKHKYHINPNQVAGMVASAVILCVILVVAPLLSALPMCVLNSIVVVALSSLLSKITELKYLWRFSKSDVMTIAQRMNDFLSFCYCDGGHSKGLFEVSVMEIILS
ncbi:inorganic anion transporter, SulP family [Teladorsagia circumcincta]|uniref:Inorganic anion transporter, SulP family n=1 Tax=Teladorsagia circumcincta TaxID=45464 RepID=A0A2G9UZW0_TELCI|nr:inorganic anion transporter, SulP family [Teladorsagia circumcincta]